ncbi:neuronal acetylcholine receptor subunit alpha-7-like isoform X2 [Anneissia japonica]|uniref:neuronal acetylcholine receptor subunit alpha-7-like isoform X2 n=1 Tax=Anneissia japonica TaxID=1529436 RepID=UPI001425AC1E|nr:neuronal acetylcholine receptor subunit alpha-7-like isoform X2 [Anneissia japonica]
MAFHIHLRTSIIIVFIAVFFPVEAQLRNPATNEIVKPGEYERQLMDDLLSKFPFREFARPAVNESESLVVAMGMALQQIMDVDEVNQIITTNIWLTLTWTDETLSWNESEYGGISSIRLPPSKIWTPDILLYNCANENFDSTYHSNVVVSSTGCCEWIPPGIFKSACSIDVTNFPWDNQTCKLKFGSWTYDGGRINLTKLDEEGDISAFKTNGEWELNGVDVLRNVVYYPCCKDPFIDITFQIRLTRKTLYYAMNLVMPCILISVLMLLVFTLPPDTGEKLSFAVTILLSLTVFMMIFTESLPPTSDSTPMLSNYFSAMLIMVAMAVVLTMTILNFHHRNPDTHTMSYLVKLVCLDWLPWFLHMSRPGHTFKGPFKNSGNLSNQEMEIEMLDQSPGYRRKMAATSGYQNNGRTPLALHQQGPTGVIGVRYASYHEQQEGLMDKTIIGRDNQGIQARDKMDNVLDELHFMTERFKKNDDDEEVVGDWKFAAMVLDRFGLIFFSIYLVIATIVILNTAPNFRKEVLGINV